MMTPKKTRLDNSTRFTVIVALAALTFACGGGSGSGGGNNNGGITTSTFTADNGSPGNNTISMSAGSSSGTMFSIDVLVTGINDFFGAEFDVTYNEAALNFVSIDSSTSLLNGQAVGTDFRVLAQNGVVQVTATLQGQAPGVDVAASQTLVRLNFNGTAATANSAIAFSSPTVDQCPDGGPPLPACTDISGTLTFSGGRVTVN